MSIIAKYKYDKSIYENLIPTFNDGYTGYTVSDEIDSVNSNHIIRTIECDSLPTRIDFGVGSTVEQYTNRSDSLLAIYNLDTSAMTDGNRMVKGCRYMTEINTSDWDTSNMVDMSGMFGYCNNLTSLDVSNWDTSNVTNMQSMFHSCTKLTTLDVSNFNTSKVTNMYTMFYNCNNLTSLDVSNFDTSNVTNMSYMFYYCNNLNSLDVSNWDTSNVTNMQNMFSICTKLTSLDVSGFDTSKVTDMGYMFNSCNKLTSLDVSNFNTSNVTNMYAMFNNCQLLTSIDVSNFNTSNVTNMYAMFSDCANLSSLELINWDVSKVTDTQYFLDGLELSSVNIKHLDLSFLELSSVTRMGGMFYKNRATDIKLPKVINPNLTSVVKTYDDGQTPKGMFYCNNLVSLDFGGLDISNVTDDKSLILEHVPKLRYIRTENAALIVDLAQYFPVRTEAEQGYLITKAEVSDEIREVLSAKYWNVVDLDEVGTDIAIYKFDKSIYKWMTPEFDNGFVDWFIDDVVEDEENEPNIVTRTIRSMGGLPTLMRFGRFLENDEVDYRLHSLIQIDCLNTNELKTMDSMFRNCVNVIEINTEGWNTSNIFYMNNVFHNCKNLTSLDVSNFDTSKVTNMRDMFSYCINLTSLDVSNFNTSKVTDMAYMFYGCNNLTSLDVSNFDNSNVITMRNMFNGCKLLTSLDVSNFNTSNVTDMTGMFYGCNNLTSIDVSNFNTSKVTDMSYMFWDCFNLTSIDVSNFDTGKVVNTNHMFVRCQSLTSIDVSNFDTGKVTNMDSMFWECSSITSLDVSNFNTSNVTNMDWMFYKCYNLTSLDVSNFDTSNVTSMNSMFGHCNSLTLLDVSNFNTSNVNSISILFIGCELITNIGMIYCDFKTVEKIASLVPTDNPTTIWVGRHIDFNALPQYDYITYKVYEVEDKLEFELSSPLLEGDRLEIIDGDLYHYHNAEFVTYDGKSCLWTYGDPVSGWDQSGDYYGFYNYYLKPYESIESKHISEILYVNNFINGGSLLVGVADINAFGRDNLGETIDNKFIVNDFITYFVIRLHKDELKEISNNGINQWLQANPTTVVYKLANPYYELVKPNVGLLNAEQGLYLNISDSIVPVVNHQDLCTIKLNYLLPNVQYKVKFKANNAGSIAINLGGTLVPLDVVEGWNEVMVTTPETLVDEYLKVNGSEGIKIQNVMVIDSNKDFDYFKGMNNTFDELEVKNLCVDRTLTYTHGVDEEGVSPQGVLNKDISKGKVVTVLGKVSNNPDNLPISINLYNDTGRATGKNLLNLPYTEENPIYRNGLTGDMYKSMFTFNAKKDEEYALSFMYDNTTQYGETSSSLFISIAYDDNGIWSNKGGTRAILSALTGSYYGVGKYIGKFTIPEDGLIYVFGALNRGTYYWDFQLEKAKAVSDYEPFRNYVNDDPVYIDYTSAVVDEGEVDVSTTDGYFAITIKADRDYANRIGFNVGDAFSCEENDQVTITDLMVIEGDVLDCHPTTYLDPSDSSYLAEFKSYNNPYGFGKNKLI